MKPNDRRVVTDDGVLRGIKNKSSKPIILERKPLPGEFHEIVLSILTEEWKRWKRYASVDAAMQAYASASRNYWSKRFEYRLKTPVGTISLPVVKA